MPAHQHCDLFYPLGWASAWVCPKLGNAPFIRSVSGSWVLTVSLSRISSQVPVSDLGEWRHICHSFRRQKMWRVTFVTFLGRMWRSRTRKYFFSLVTFFVTSFPKNVTFWPRQYKKKLNGKKCDDSAGTETCFFLIVSDLSLISEAWRGKAIWAKTDPKCLIGFVPSA